MSPLIKYLQALVVPVVGVIIPKKYVIGEYILLTCKKYTYKANTKIIIIVFLFLPI